MVLKINMTNFKLINAHVTEKWLHTPNKPLRAIIDESEPGELVPVLSKPTLYTVEPRAVHNCRIFALNWILIASRKFVAPSLPMNELQVIKYEKEFLN